MGKRPRTKQIALRDSALPQEGSYEEAKEWVTVRMLQNLAWTGHPLHHATADGTIVEADPTLEELVTHVAPDELPPIPAALAGALPAVPVIRDWYEREPGRTWMQQDIARS